MIMEPKFLPGTDLRDEYYPPTIKAVFFKPSRMVCNISNTPSYTETGNVIDECGN